MFRDTKFAGISFRSRSRRRALVVGTYTVTLTTFAFMVTGQNGFRAGGFLGLIFIMVSNVIFGSIVHQQTFPDRESEPVQGLGLKPSVSLNAPAPDEYEQSVRDRAYYKAFKLLFWIWVAIAPAVCGIMERNKRISLQIGLFAVLTVTLLLFSLPQAIILWEQPDFVED